MFKQIDVAPIMTFDGLPRPVPCSIIYKLQPTLMAGKPFHIIVFTKVVNGQTVLGGTSFWSPQELKDNVIRVGQSKAEADAFKASIAQALASGGVTPQSVDLNTADGTAPNEVLETATGAVNPVVDPATPVDDSQSILDEIANIKT